MMSRIVKRMLLCCIAVAAIGCANDPYSQERISMRRAHFEKTLEGMIKYERSHKQRLDENKQKIKKWWQDDIEMYHKRIKKIGYHFW